MTQSVFLTGASGCVGHYLVEELAQDPDLHLYLLVRDPARLRLDVAGMANVTLVVDDFLDIERHAELVGRMDHLIHVAAAWGQPVAYEVNYRLAHRFFAMADPARVRRIVFFSTASVLDRDNSLLEAAGRVGTDYIRSKYLGVKELDGHPLFDKIVTVFPTLVFGGSARHPASHLSTSLRDLPRWRLLLRYVGLEGSLHFIHARDIARIVHHLLKHPVEGRRLVLGNPSLSLNQALDALAGACGAAPGRRWDLEPVLGLVARLARSRMNDWDRFSLTHRHFTYQSVHAATFGLPTDLAELGAVVREGREALGA